MPLPIAVGNPDIATPAHRVQRGKCADCPLWDQCLFNQPRMGGFKGTGTHYIGYRLITDEAEGQNAKEDFCTCRTFTETMQDRMLDGDERLMRGEHGETVAIIKQEGEYVEQYFQVGFNTRNEVIKPQPNQVEWLEESGYKVNLEDRSQAIEFRDVMIRRKVPRYKPLSRDHTDYSTKLIAREAKRRSRESAIADQVWREAGAATPATPEPEVEPVSKLPEPSGQVPLAEPVKPKPR